MTIGKQEKKYRAVMAGLMLAVIVPGGQSCKDENDIAPDTVEIKQAQIEAGEAGGTVEVRFIASGKWTAEISADWLAMDRMEGMGTYLTKLNVTIKKNDAREPRTATIAILCGTAKGEIILTQGENTEPLPKVLDPSEIPDYGKFHKPAEHAGLDMMTEGANWSFFRHKQSEHFFVFWEPGFGDDPNAETVSADLRVDIDDLLEKAEQFYTTNVDVLKFVETGQGKSYLDQYKMQIYLYYTSEWMAYGSGYDNVIGALWINPSTCKPVGATIAHEIGHSFQYQVYCDKLLNGATDNMQQGFRYGYEGSNGGNGFWEQCAQWQSFQNYPAELFGHHVSVWEANSHRHFEHEWMRYAGYWLQYHWVTKHGVEVVGEIWKRSQYPEDALSTYLRLYCNGNPETLYAELYDYAARMVTYDIDGVRNYKTPAAGNYTTKLFETGNGYYQVGYAGCPGTTGFNVIRLNLPEGGNTITAIFEGLAPGSSLADTDPGNQIDGDGATVANVRNYNANSNTDAGWRYGFVSVVNGTAQYSPMYKENPATVSYTVPPGTTDLYMVVMGAPGTYAPHPWNDNEADDAQWPYKVKFEGTDLLGHFYVDETATPQDIILTYDLDCDASFGEYIIGNINLAHNQRLAQAFAMQPAALESKLMAVGSSPEEGKVAVALLQSDGTYSYAGNANNGFWCNAVGDLGSWSNGGVYVEFAGLTLTYGHRPGMSITPGTTAVMKPVLIYTKNGTQYKATIVLNMHF
jgi:hypothetical protein